MEKNNFKSSNEQIGMVVGECVGTVVTILLTEAGSVVDATNQV